jgi:hypothetical protein
VKWSSLGVGGGEQGGRRLWMLGRRGRHGNMFGVVGSSVQPVSKGGTYCQHRGGGECRWFWMRVPILAHNWPVTVVQCQPGGGF